MTLNSKTKKKWKQKRNAEALDMIAKTEMRTLEDFSEDYLWDQENEILDAEILLKRKYNLS